MSLSLDDKRAIVLKHYESAYSVKFSRPVPDKDIEFLYGELVKLQESLSRESNPVKVAPRHVRLVASNTEGNRTARAYPPRTDKTFF